MDSLLRKFDPGSTHSLFSTLFWCFRHQVLVKGYVDVVVIVCGSEEIARHRRSYGREELIFDPLHHLALLERKTGALDQAAPLTGWALPDEFLRLRRLLETRLGKAGTREYVQVLRLLEDFRLAHVRGAIQDAPPEIISHAVWLYHRYCMSFRDVEDLLAERGIIVSYETVRGAPSRPPRRMPAANTARCAMDSPTMSASRPGLMSRGGSAHSPGPSE